ncbi:GntR family transcriptional regulator [Bombilactobacillus bombi]|uniref:GntR family transcriptional regulator n=1 Tax=Bombilactobacillus bombi TaxID=1303590 RepID=UPI0015E5C283|nr:GntR family transcriptional regulator [Bombilactobacillus bombi]MBA1433647.1 GntR family transcriptional regulator [Bombilactobacillus bombi]
MAEILYQKIRNDIKNKIITGDYPQDSKLPNEIELQNYYQVSRVTLRNAINGLVKEGLVERIQGKGTFVRQPHKLNRLICKSSVESFTDIALENGLTPSFRVLKVEHSSYPEIFGVKVNNKIALYIQRICKVNNEPIMLENNYYTLPRFQNLEKYDLKQSMYTLLDKQFNIKKLHSDDTTLSMISCNLKEAQLLNKPVGFPLFCLDTVVLDENNELVHVGQQYIVADRYQFKI